LILPVVICFFQGLSHANVSGPEVQGDCVRLIKRLIVYPTEIASAQSYGITAPKRAANTWKNDLPNTNQPRGQPRGRVGGCYWPKQRTTPRNRQLELLTQANEAEAHGNDHVRCWTNSPPIR